MKTLDKIKTIGVSLVFITMVLAGCKKETLSGQTAQSSNSTATSNNAKIIPVSDGNLTVHLINTSPMAKIYGAVDVEVIKVEAEYDNRDGWVLLTKTPNIYNLLFLEKAALVDNVHLASGHIVKLRLTFGTQNSIVMANGIKRSVFNLAVPYSTTEVSVNAAIQPNLSTFVTVDFKANASISNEGDGIFILYPIINQVRIIPVPTDVPTVGTL